MNEQEEYDVAILGGGLAGLTLTKQLLMREPDTRIVVLEKRAFPVSESAYKVGESTVEIGAHYLGETVALKKHLVDDQLPKFGLRFFFKQGNQSLSEGTEVGGSDFFPAPGYQVDRGRLENYLAKTISELGATFLTESRVREIRLNVETGKEPTTPHEIQFARKDQIQSLKCRWLIDASGRASLLKRQLDLAEDIGHDINAVWFRIGKDIRIDQWCDDEDWRSRTGKVPRRWLSTNHLLGSGYWVWLIPLATGATSIGIVADPRIHPLNELNRFDKAFAWLEEHEPLCADAIRTHQDKIQDFMAIRSMSRGCRQVFSSDRWALTGEAAVFLDPLYSPGIDYIAMGNTMIVKLIEEERAGRSLQHLAPTLQSVFLTLFQNNLLTYRDQYPLFGNPRIMSLKYVWDYALYWSFPALLYFRNKLTDPAFIQSLSGEIEAMRDMNLKMQEFFRDWYQQDKQEDADPVFVDQKEIDILIQLNAELREEIDDRVLRQRFSRNVVIVRDLMNEMIGRVRSTHPAIPSSTEVEAVTEPRLRGVFEALNI